MSRLLKKTHAVPNQTAGESEQYHRSICLEETPAAAGTAEHLLPEQLKQNEGNQNAMMGSRCGVVLQDYLLKKMNKKASQNHHQHHEFVFDEMQFRNILMHSANSTGTQDAGEPEVD